MRREGRVRGSYARMDKHDEFEYNSPYKSGPRKPTNHSKVSGCCLSNRPRCYYCHTAPPLKAMCKTKGKYKLKDLDVTKNYKLDEFAVKLQEYSYHSEYDDYDDETLHESENHRSSEVMFAVASFLRDMRGAHQITTDVRTPDSNSEEETLDEALQQQEFPSELTRQISTETDSDELSWSGIEVSSDSDHGGVDVDGWYLVG